jgi:hypothetical protein
LDVGFLSPPIIKQREFWNNLLGAHVRLSVFLHWVAIADQFCTISLPEQGQGSTVSMRLAFSHLCLASTVSFRKVAKSMTIFT